MAQVLDNRTWRFLYSQITTGQIGQQALFDSSYGIKSSPDYDDGLFTTGDADQGLENFYSGIVLTVNPTSAFTNEIAPMANYYAQKNAANSYSETLLGYMGTGLANGTILFRGLSDTTTKYHTILFNTNAPNQSGIILYINYYLTSTLKFTQSVSANSAPSPAGQNFIYNLPRATSLSSGDPTAWNRFEVVIVNGQGFTTNFVGVLKNTNPVTPENLVCFAENSMVFTPKGEVPIQDLKQGDVVYDENFNHQTVEFVAKRTVFPSKSINKYSIPYEIKQGQLSENVPNRDTIVSAAHLISHNGQMVPASKLGNEINVDSAITFYNVSVSNYSTMIVNGMVSETLDTTNDTKVYEKTF